MKKKDNVKWWGGVGGDGVYLSQIRRSAPWSTSKNVNRKFFFRIYKWCMSQEAIK